MNATAYRAAEDAYWRAHGVTVREERVVEIPDMETNVRLQLVGSGEPLLFVHGGPNAGTTWAPLCSRLRDRCCIVIDRPGCGLSSPVDYARASFPEIATTVLLETLDALEVERADIVASSLGGSWALWFVQRHPDRVGSIVQMSCPAFLPDMDMKAAIFLRLIGLPVLGAALTMMPASDIGTVQTFQNMGHGSTLAAGGLGPEFFAWSKALLNHTDTLRSDRRAIQKGMTFRHMRPEVVFSDESLRGIENRVHWFWGEQDPFAPVSTPERLVKLMQNATAEMLENGGHLPWLDSPERAERAVRITTS